MGGMSGTGQMGQMGAVGGAGWAGWAGWAGSMLGGVLGEVTPPSSFTRSSACSAARHSRQARRPAVAPAAGSVAASKARRCQTKQQKWGTEFVPTTWVNQRCGGRVLGETQHRAIEGIAGAHTKPPNATCQRRADEFQRTPSESGRPGRIQGARAKSSQVHASRSAARAPAPREASHLASEPKQTAERPPASTRTPSPAHRTSPSATGRVASPAAPAGRPEAAGRPPSARRAPNTPP